MKYDYFLQTFFPFFRCLPKISRLLLFLIPLLFLLGMWIVQVSYQLVCASYCFTKDVLLVALWIHGEDVEAKKAKFDLWTVCECFQSIGESVGSCLMKGISLISQSFLDISSNCKNWNLFFFIPFRRSSTELIKSGLLVVVNLHKSWLLLVAVSFCESAFIVFC